MAKRPTPKKQQAKSQSSKRYKAFQNRARKRLSNSANLTLCPKCKEARLSHAVCPGCGEYKGRKVLDMEKQIDKITKVKA
jgi:large subunit ribosomal protein L32